MKKQVNIIVVRHGQSNANKGQAIQDDLSNSDHLTELGRLQAAKAGERMALETFCTVYSSDMARAKETAQIIVQKNQKKPNQEIRENKKIREKSFGNLAGMSMAMIQKEIDSLTDESSEHSNSILSSTEGGGESIQQVIDRASNFFSEDLTSAILTEDLDTVLLVTHSAFIMAVLTVLVRKMKAELPEGVGQKDVRKVCPNTSITRIMASVDKETGKWEDVKVTTMYDGEHVKDLRVE